jgi:hypothetical protein
MSCKDPRMGDMFGHAAKVFLCFYKLDFIFRSRSTFGVRNNFIKPYYLLHQSLRRNFSAKFIFYEYSM